MWDRFLKGDDVFKNNRLKLIANISEGPWIVKTAVGEQAICILGRSLTCRSHSYTPRFPTVSIRYCGCLYTVVVHGWLLISFGSVWIRSEWNPIASYLGSGLMYWGFLLMFFSYLDFLLFANWPSQVLVELFNNIVNADGVVNFDG